MEVESNVIKKELTTLKTVAEKTRNIKAVATKLDDIGSDHIPTIPYRSGSQARFQLLTHVSDLVATAKQGKDVSQYAQNAQKTLTKAIKIDPAHVYSLPKFTEYSIQTLIQSINQKLKQLN